MSLVLRHASLYSAGNVLVTLASLISFPLLTRLLSVSDYGLMNTVALTLTLLVAIGKLGMQRSTLRFYHEARKGGADHSPQALVSTLVYGMLLAGFATAAGWFAILNLMPPACLGDPALRILLLLTSSLIVVRVAESAFLNVYYAEERSAIVAGYAVFKRYLVLGVVLAALLLLRHDALTFFAATITAELAAVVIIAALFVRQHPLQARLYSRRLLEAMVRYGLPMVGVEMAWSLLAVGDRYVINQLLGAEAVGTYSASYNLCEYVKSATMLALSAAVAPIYMRIWEHQGRAATEAFLGSYARGYLAASLLVSALVSASAAPLIMILASSKYLEGTPIVPWVMLGMALESYVAVAAAGLFLKKRTGSMLWIVAAAALLNLVLNYCLIPPLGLIGAAVATLLSFAALMVATLIVGRSELRIRFPLRTLLLGTLGFLASVWLCARVRTASPWLDLIARSSLVVTLFAAILLGFDRDLRDDVRGWLPGLRKRFGL